ncbi:MAG TPA: hypothetical protein VJT50_01515, partial [Pyrinomonadaceae bacterium]|nr:hypothetical protein [Pyrinomonadaceae bacterium]
FARWACVQMKFAFGTKRGALLVGAMCPALLVGQTMPEQTVATKNCPTITVACPAALNFDRSLTFQANVAGAVYSLIGYHWQVSSGRILEGQGTSIIKVDMHGFGGQAIVATVSISGLTSVCPAQASCALLPGLPPPPARLFDRYYPTHLAHATTKRRRAKRGTFASKARTKGTRGH